MSAPDELPPGFAACLACAWQADPAGEPSPVQAAYAHAIESGHPVIARPRVGPPADCVACHRPRDRDHLCRACWSRLPWSYRRAILAAEGRGSRDAPGAVSDALAAAVGWLRPR